MFVLSKTRNNPGPVPPHRQRTGGLAFICSYCQAIDVVDAVDDVADDDSTLDVEAMDVVDAVVDSTQDVVEEIAEDVSIVVDRSYYEPQLVLQRLTFDLYIYCLLVLLFKLILFIRGTVYSLSLHDEQCSNVHESMISVMFTCAEPILTISDRSWILVHQQHRLPTAH